MTLTLRGRRQRIREFIDTLMEAHFDPESARPTLGALAGCLTDEEADGLPSDEELAVRPGRTMAHPTGRLRRDGGHDIWARLPHAACYLHIPREFEVGYKFEMCGNHAALALQAAPLAIGLGLSEDFVESPVDRLIIDPLLVVILMPISCHHDDVEIAIS